jgi:hypothetical protein
MHIKFKSENQKGRDRSEHLGVDGKIIIIMDLKEIGWEVVNWMHPSQDKVLWRILVNMVMNLRVP